MLSFMLLSCQWLLTQTTQISNRRQQVQLNYIVMLCEKERDTNTTATTTTTTNNILAYK